MSSPGALSVLLVEDSVMDARLLTESIRSEITAGHVVVQTVRSLADARDALQRFSFSAVLLDLGLPDGRGVGNVHALRQVDKGAAIIVLTGLDDERSAAEAMQQGAQDYLVKGDADGERLLKLLRRSVERNRKNVALEVEHDNQFLIASRDRVTQLPNRALLLDRLRQWRMHLPVGSPRAHVHLVRLVGVEALRRKGQNQLADEALRRAALAMLEHLNLGDTLARLDEGNFVLLTPVQDFAAAQALAHGLAAHLQKLAWPPGLGGLLDAVSSSVMAWEEESSEALLHRALRAADVGRLPADAVSQPVLSAEDLPALKPMWKLWANLDTEQFLGAELVYAREDDAALPELHSLPTQEAVGLLLAGVRLLGQGIDSWGSRGPQLLGLDVPLPALADEQLPARILQVLKEGRLRPEAVVLDLPEQALRHGQRYAAVLQRLSLAGFQLYIEGDGGSEVALHELVRLPTAGFKLSKAYLQSLLDEGLHGQRRRLVDAMKGVAQSVGGVLKAQGADDAEALSALRIMGIAVVQGAVIAPNMGTVDMMSTWQQGQPQW